MRAYNPKPLIFRTNGITFDSSSFEQNNKNYDEWSSEHQDLIKSIQKLRKIELYWNENSDIHLLIEKILDEKLIPKQELIDQLTSTNIIDGKIYGSDSKRMRPFVNSGSNKDYATPMLYFASGYGSIDSSVNGGKIAIFDKLKLNMYGSPEMIGSSTVLKLTPSLVLNKDIDESYNWWYMSSGGNGNPQHGKGQFNWFNSVIDYHDVESTIDSDSVLNLPLSEYQKMRDYYDFVDWDREDTVFEKKA